MAVGEAVVQGPGEPALEQGGDPVDSGAHHVGGALGVHDWDAEVLVPRVSMAG
jgi:hypothetical protein